MSALDAFNDPLPSADAYVLSWILHDWEDDRCVQLLRLSGMKWKKAGAEEYGFLPASAVVAQRASGRLWIWAEPGRAEA